MSAPAGPTGRTRDLERFLTFVDAVVAIAITLLVLPLVDVASEFSPDDAVTDLLVDHASQIGAFLLSFVVIASLWSSQHQLMRTAVAEHPLVGRLLLLWTLTIVVLPFPTALVAASGHQAASKVLYIGTMAVSSACLALVAMVLARHPEVRDGGDAPEPAVAWLTVAVFLLALVLTLVVPPVGYWPLLLLLLTGPLLRGWRRVGGPGTRVGE